MDDDLPKEGELLDISRNKKTSTTASQNSTTEETQAKPVKIPTAFIGVVIFLAVAAFVAKVATGNASPEQIEKYQQGTYAVFSDMKNQFPHLVSVVCEGSDPSKQDCIHFVGTFRPNKDSPNYLASMDTNDKVYGASQTDIALIKEQIKRLVEIKRTTLTSVRDPFTFRIDSVNIPRVGGVDEVKIRCTEDRVEVVECASEK